MLSRRLRLAKLSELENVHENRKVYCCWQGTTCLDRTTSPKHCPHPTAEVCHRGKELCLRAKDEKRKYNARLVFPIQWHEAIFVSRQDSQISHHLRLQSWCADDVAHQYAYEKVSLMSVRLVVQPIRRTLLLRTLLAAVHCSQARAHGVVVRHHPLPIPLHLDGADWGKTRSTLWP